MRARGLSRQGGWGRPLSGGDAGPRAQLTQRSQLCNTLREQCSERVSTKVSANSECRGPEAGMCLKRIRY